MKGKEEMVGKEKMAHMQELLQYAVQKSVQYPVQIIVQKFVQNAMHILVQRSVQNHLQKKSANAETFADTCAINQVVDDSRKGAMRL